MICDTNTYTLCFVLSDPVFRFPKGIIDDRSATGHRNRATWPPDVTRFRRKRMDYLSGTSAILRARRWPGCSTSRSAGARVAHAEQSRNGSILVDMPARERAGSRWRRWPCHPVHKSANSLREKKKERETKKKKRKRTSRKLSGSNSNQLHRIETRPRSYPR